MRRRALIGALSIVFLVPLASAWCPQCFAGACSMGTAAEPSSPAAAEASCHFMPAAPPLAVLAAESACCGMSMGPSSWAGEAPAEAAYFGFQIEPAPGGEAPRAPQIYLSLGDPPPERFPSGLSTPLFILHRSLQL